jgi:hypothetical protein
MRRLGLRLKAARYAWQDTTYVAGAANPTSGSTSPVVNKNLTFGYTHTITARLERFSLRPHARGHKFGEQLPR